MFLLYRTACLSLMYARWEPDHLQNLHIQTPLIWCRMSNGIDNKFLLLFHATCDACFQVLNKLVAKCVCFFAYGGSAGSILLPIYLQRSKMCELFKNTSHRASRPFFRGLCIWHSSAKVWYICMRLRTTRFFGLPMCDIAI